MRRNKKKIVVFIISVIAMVVLFALNLFFGSVSIPAQEVVNIIAGNECTKESWRFIVVESRFPQALTALFSGASLSLSGLMLQTSFRNPLAGPSIFGINSGAALGVAFVMLMPVSVMPFLGNGEMGSIHLSIMSIIAAFIGAMAVLGIILAFSTIVKSNVMLLIVGIMIGYISSSAISLLNFFATEEGVQSYMVWGLGNFSGVTFERLPLFIIVNMLGIIFSLLHIKPLNALLLGEEYAENLGFNINSIRNRLLLITGIQAAITTAFCGPIAFIGLAVPHIARILLGSDNHQQLMPATIITGANTALICNVLSTLPGDTGVIPINAITPLIGAPVVIYIIAKQRIKE